MGKYKRKKDGVFLDPKTGRMMEHRGLSTRLYWSPQMIDYLIKNFANSSNQDLSDWIGYNEDVVTRKAKELGLKKSPEWIYQKNLRNCQLAFYAAKRKGFPGKVKKGEHRSPNTEFKKGHKPSEESIKRHKSAVVAWNKMNPDKVRERIEKARQTRLNKQNTQLL